jgi:hypothetical protein
MAAALPAPPPEGAKISLNARMASFSFVSIS